MMTTIVALEVKMVDDRRNLSASVATNDENADNDDDDDGDDE